MAIGTGTAAIAAFKKATTWGTPISTNVANAGLYILGDTLPVGVPEYVQDESLGSHGKPPAIAEFGCDGRHQSRSQIRCAQHHFSSLLWRCCRSSPTIHHARLQPRPDPHRYP